MKTVSIRQAVLFGWMSAGLGLAQQATPAPEPVAPPTAPSTPTTPSTGGRPSPNIGVGPQTPQPSAPRQPAVIFITGNVTLPDGTEPPDRVLIERNCSTNRVRSEGYTDSKGRFSIQLGQSQMLIPDASESMFMDGTQGFGSNASSSSLPSSGMDPMLDCELRARLAGYRSSTILLAGRRAMDNPNVGTLVLYPLTGQEGLAVSATSAGASKDARKAFNKGASEARKQKFDNAEKELRKAVDLHPKYAEAWVELGKVYAVRKRYDEARGAFDRAVEADSRYVYSYEGLYKIALEQGRWPDLADSTDKLLRLNPYEFRDAYYYNGVAHLQLNHLDLAEQSLQRALDGDKRHSNPKVLYVMGIVQAQSRKYPEAITALTTFVEISPSDPLVPKVRQMLEELHKTQ
jgi:TolA-binding protein